MKRVLVISSLFIFLSYNSSGQSVVINPDGTHSVVLGNVVVNPNGTHSVVHGNIVVNPDGTHSVIHGNIIITPNGTTSVSQEKSETRRWFRKRCAADSLDTANDLSNAERKKINREKRKLRRQQRRQK